MGERKGDLQSYFPVKLFSLSSRSWLGFMNFNERQYMRENCLKIQPLLAVAFNCAKKDNTFSDRTNSASHYLPGCPKDQPMSVGNPGNNFFKEVANNVHVATRGAQFLEIILGKSKFNVRSCIYLNPVEVELYLTSLNKYLELSGETKTFEKQRML